MTVRSGKNRDNPYLLVLGIAQDGGVPQAGEKRPALWADRSRRRLAASLALVDPKGNDARWIFEATPDFREQLARLDEDFPVQGSPGLNGIFLTHAHIGHYAGLIFLGRESMSAQNTPLYAMPRMADFLRANGPWNQLVDTGNVELRPLGEEERIDLNGRLAVTPFSVPHRQEFSETVAFRIEGPDCTVLFLPDVDSWEDWEGGRCVEDLLSDVDVAYLDGTFFSSDELPGREISRIPHPTIRESMNRFSSLSPEARSKIRFIHLNHTNRALQKSSGEYRDLIGRGFRVAQEGERVDL